MAIQPELALAMSKRQGNKSSLVVFFAFPGRKRTSPSNILHIPVAMVRKLLG